MKMAVATTTHQTYNTNGGMEETVEHGPTGANEAKLPVRANVTRRYADACAAPTTAVVVTEIGCHPCPSASSSTQILRGPPEEILG